jgi:hypothetical protein
MDSDWAQQISQAPRVSMSDLMARPKTAYDFRTGQVLPDGSGGGMGTAAATNLQATEAAARNLAETMEQTQESAALLTRHLERAAAAGARL